MRVRLQNKLGIVFVHFLRKYKVSGKINTTGKQYTTAGCIGCDKSHIYMIISSKLRICIFGPNPVDLPAYSSSTQAMISW